jgi:hypothetical protein
VPSQYGLRAEPPQRHRNTSVQRSTVSPVAETISIGPISFTGPFGISVIFTGR